MTCKDCFFYNPFLYPPCNLSLSCDYPDSVEDYCFDFTVKGGDTFDRD